MTVELKACPFCGGKARMTGKRRGNYRREGTNYQALCGSCKARGPLVQDLPEKAAEAWNDRVAVLAVSDVSNCRVELEIQNWPVADKFDTAPVDMTPESIEAWAMRVAGHRHPLH